MNIRIIAATNKDLEDMVKKPLFRQDLYYRLNVVPLKTPALRGHKEDIFYFVNQFLKTFNKKHGFHKTISNRASNSLCRYDWPGNVRELSNVIECLVVITAASVIDASDAEEVFSLESGTYAERKDFSKGMYQNTLEEFEEIYFNSIFPEGKTLEEMAKDIGLSISTLKRKLRKYNLRKHRKAHN